MVPFAGESLILAAGTHAIAPKCATGSLPGWDKAQQATWGSGLRCSASGASGAGVGSAQ